MRRAMGLPHRSCVFRQTEQMNKRGVGLNSEGIISI